MRRQPVRQIRHPHLKSSLGSSLSYPSNTRSNPVTGTNWEGTGVIPDVKVLAIDAFTEAYERIKERLGPTTAGDMNGAKAPEESGQDQRYDTVDEL